MQTAGFEAFQSVVPSQVCARLRRTVLSEAAELQRQEASWVGKAVGAWRRVVGSPAAQRAVRSPEHRVHVPLLLTEDAREALATAAQGLHARGAWTRAALGPGARLVELSAMVALPGAAAQHPHTDVPPHSPLRLCTLWVALQDVDKAMGPTVIFPEAPACLAARVDWAAVQRAAGSSAEQRRPLVFSADGEVESDFVDGAEEAPARSATISGLNTGDTSSCAAGGVPRSTEELGLAEPVAVELRVGGVALMDCRAFHYGGANKSSVPRALFSATFQGEDEDKGKYGSAGCHADATTVAASARGAGGAGDEPSGFTYEIHDDLAGRYTLADFLQPLGPDKQQGKEKRTVCWDS